MMNDDEVKVCVTSVGCALLIAGFWILSLAGGREKEELRSVRSDFLQEGQT